jgi:hypothetical protein
MIHNRNLLYKGLKRLDWVIKDSRSLMDKLSMLFNGCLADKNLMGILEVQFISVGNSDLQGKES